MERTLHEGFADNELRLCVFTDHQLFDRFHKYNLKSDKARSGKVALSLKELNQFTPGDYVVHTDHGVGRFSGLVRIRTGDTTQEVMKLVYQNDDVVFVSIHSLHKVSKYKGKEGEPPRSINWEPVLGEKLKERTDTKIKDIARDLIKLYSQRREEKGFAYSPDSFLQRKLEASFIYEDTPDQSATPIPRTLQFSLMGARDLSVISTPPPNRYPIQTELHTFNEEIIADAINFEMSRNGQVFFVNNRIANLPELKVMILRHIPDRRIAIGHGQMEPSELEQIMDL